MSIQYCILGVALHLLQRFHQMPLAHKSHFESDCVQPLYALARMPSVFPSGSGYGFIRQFFNDSKVFFVFFYFHFAYFSN